MLNNGRSSFLSNIPPVTKNLLIINFIIWLAMLIVPSKLGFDAIAYGGLHYFSAPDFNPVQLLTYMFMHSTDTFAHLFSTCSPCGCSASPSSACLDLRDTCFST